MIAFLYVFFSAFHIICQRVAPKMNPSSQPAVCQSKQPHPVTTSLQYKDECICLFL